MTETLEELVARDKQREEDGFKRKIKIKSVPVSEKKVVNIPIVHESKLIHGDFEPTEEGGTGGTGEGEEGEVVHEESLEDEGQPMEAGEDPSDDHPLDSDVLDIVENLLKEHELPNLEEKGKRVPVDEYTYDLLQVYKGSGQVVDKRRTIRQIVKDNLALGNLDPDDINTKDFLIAQSMKWYRVMSRERKYTSKAAVFFVRDYSGSMMGETTAAVVSQHQIIYVWLMKQYGENLVEPYFILHDSEAKQVSNFDAYLRARVAGGTKVASGYKLVNKIIKERNLAQDYNIYVFHGTDGDDWDNNGKDTTPELEEMIKVSNRVGITVVAHDYSMFKQASNIKTTVETYVDKSGFLKSYHAKFRLVSMKSNQVNTETNVKAVRTLIAK